MIVFDVGNGLISSHLVRNSSDFSSLGWINSSRCVIERRDFRNAQFPYFRPVLDRKIDDGLIIFGIKNISRIDEEFLAKAADFFEILFQYGFTRVLCLSSVAVYGDIRDRFASEKDELNPLTEYGQNKEKIERFFVGLVPQSVLIMRISNLFGVPQLRPNCFLDAYIYAVKEKNLFISQFDEDFRRDFISFEFLIFSLSTILKKYRWDKKIDIFNICSGESISFGMIIEESRNLGFSPQIEYGSDHGNVASSCISAKKMIEQFSLQYSADRFWMDFSKGLLR